MEEPLSGFSSEGDGVEYHRRVRFTTEQLLTLEEVYKRTEKPPRQIKEQLARDFSTTYKRIQVWFQNRRARQRREEKSSLTSEVSIST